MEDKTMANRPAMPLWQQIAIELFVMAAIGLALGFLGPFGSYAMPTPLRLTYWVGFIIVGYIIYRPISVCAYWLSETTGIAIWLSTALAIIIAALPLTLLIGFAIGGMDIRPILESERFAILYIQVGLIGFAINLFMQFLFKDTDEARKYLVDSETAGAATQSEPEPVETTLHKRLPAGFPQQIEALGVEDHYVKVHATDAAGTPRAEMLLMRLGDAITETTPLEGMQVHRSWWIARVAIVSAKRDGRAIKLKLRSGLTVPVSRSHEGKLKQSGWI